MPSKNAIIAISVIVSIVIITAITLIIVYTRDNNDDTTLPVIPCEIDTTCVSTDLPSLIYNYRGDYALSISSDSLQNQIRSWRLVKVGAENSVYATAFECVFMCIGDNTAVGVNISGEDVTFTAFSYSTDIVDPFSQAPAYTTTQTIINIDISSLIGLTFNHTNQDFVCILNNATTDSAVLITFEDTLVYSEKYGGAQTLDLPSQVGETGLSPFSFENLIGITLMGNSIAQLSRDVSQGWSFVNNSFFLPPGLFALSFANTPNELTWAVVLAEAESPDGYTIQFYTRESDTALFENSNIIKILNSDTVFTEYFGFGLSGITINDEDFFVFCEFDKSNNGRIVYVNNKFETFVSDCSPNINVATAVPFSMSIASIFSTKTSMTSSVFFPSVGGFDMMSLQGSIIKFDCV